MVRYDRHADRTRREQALLTEAAGGYISAEGNVELEAGVSIAAGNMARAAGQRDTVLRTRTHMHSAGARWARVDAEAAAHQLPAPLGGLDSALPLGFDRGIALRLERKVADFSLWHSSFKC